MSFYFSSADTVKTRARKPVERFTNQSHFKPRKRKSHIGEVALFNQGVDFLEQSKYNEAISIFQKTANHSLSQYNIGLCHLGLEQSKKAADCFKRALDIDTWSKNEVKKQCMALLQELGVDPKEDEESLFEKACAFMEAKQYENARDLLLKLSPHGLIQYNLGLCFYHLNDRENASIHFKHSLQAEQYPWDKCMGEQIVELQDSAKYHLGEIMMDQAEQGNQELHKEAREWFQGCKEPLSGPTYYNIGLSYEREGNRLQAKEWYEQCLEREWPGMEEEEVVDRKEQVKETLHELFVANCLFELSAIGEGS